MSIMQLPRPMKDKYFIGCVASTQVYDEGILWMWSRIGVYLLGFGLIGFRNEGEQISYDGPNYFLQSLVKR